MYGSLSKHTLCIWLVFQTVLAAIFGHSLHPLHQCLNMLNVFIKASLTVLYYLQAPIITSPYTIRSDQIQFKKNDNNMQLSAIRLRGGVEGIIIMHVLVLHILTGTRQSVVLEHTTYVLCVPLSAPHCLLSISLTPVQFQLTILISKHNKVSLLVYHWISEFVKLKFVVTFYENVHMDIKKTETLSFYCEKKRNSSRIPSGSNNRKQIKTNRSLDKTLDVTISD